MSNLGDAAPVALEVVEQLAAPAVVQPHIPRVGPASG